MKYHTTDKQVNGSISENLEVIKNEVLALSFVAEKAPSDPTTKDEDLNLEIWIEKA